MHSHVHRPSAHLEAPWQAESSDFPRRAIHAQADSQWQPVTPQTCLSRDEPHGAPSANSEPNLLADLWASGFRCHLSCVADASTAEREIVEWLAGSSSNATSISVAADRFIESPYILFAKIWLEERRMLRVRDVQGTLHKIDVTEADEPERPILNFYSLIQAQSWRDANPGFPHITLCEGHVRRMIAQKEKRLESSGRYARLSRRRPVKRPNSCSVNLLCTAKNSPKTNPCLPMPLLFFTHPTNRTHQIPRIRRIRPILQTQRLGQLPIVAPKLPLPPVSPGTMPRAA